MARNLKYFERLGFDFLPDWTMDEPRTPERILMPSGRIMDLSEIQKNSQITEFGNRDQIECMEALEFYGLVRDLSADERYSRYNASFIDDQDVQRCVAKYSKRRF